MGGFRRRFTELSARFRYRLADDGFVPEPVGWVGFAAALPPALRELAADTEHLRTCANCDGVIYDRSRKGHKVWCGSAACGNRVTSAASTSGDAEARRRRTPGTRPQLTAGTTPRAVP